MKLCFLAYAGHLITWLILYSTQVLCGCFKTSLSSSSLRILWWFSWMNEYMAPNIVFFCVHPTWIVTLNKRKIKCVCACVLPIRHFNLKSKSNHRKRNGEKSWHFFRSADDKRTWNSAKLNWITDFSFSSRLNKVVEEKGWKKDKRMFRKFQLNNILV